MFGARLVPEGPGRFVGSDFFMPLPVGVPTFHPKPSHVCQIFNYFPTLYVCAPACVGSRDVAADGSLRQQCIQTRNAAVCSAEAA